MLVNQTDSQEILHLIRQSQTLNPGSVPINLYRITINILVR